MGLRFQDLSRQRNAGGDASSVAGARHAAKRDTAPATGSGGAHSGNLALGRASGKGESRMSFADLYPDEHESMGSKKLADARAAFAALPRCRCGLLLPCNDCLPTSAVEHIETRMYAGSDPVLPPEMSGAASSLMQAPRNKWLREHDRRAGYVVPREGR